MSQTVLANGLYAVLVIGAFVLEHFGLLPAGTANLVLAGVFGSAATTGTLRVIPGAPVTTKGNLPAVVSQGSTVQTNSPVNDPGIQG